ALDHYVHPVTSDCLHTFKWDPAQTNSEFKSMDSAPEQCLEAAGRTRINALAHRTARCSISSPAGMYWVCGNLAYPYLPVDYKGRCGLAYASSASLPPTARYAWWTAGHGCYAPSPRSNPVSGSQTEDGEKGSH
uniref:Uncharacterized protein n=1 Tax=Seriola lalandi dorsalis TaxID=1841481 RepID=A0A3B4WRW1_SERLL